MSTAYKTILYKSFFEDTIFVIIAGLILLVLLIVELVKKKRVKVIGVEGFMLGLCVVAVLVAFVTVQLDINKNDVVQVGYSEGYLYTQSRHKEFSLISPYYFKTDEGYNVELGTVGKMPTKLENGTIIYSKHSQVLLDYTADKTSYGKFDNQKE